jgi:L-alanine-DL-glutamate epimerase-like enolase superfamily enzyme
MNPGHTPGARPSARIGKVEAICIRAPEPLAARDWWVTTPMDVFSDRDRLSESHVGSTNVLVRVTTDDGVVGVGTVGLGSPAAKAVIDLHLTPLILGHDAFDVELIWEKMFRSTVSIGRKGLVLEAISAIDIALWDIMGKRLGVPVCDLLGGRTRTRIRAYASQSYARDDLDAVREEAARYAREGFTALKMRFGWGPRDGEPGKRRNRQLVETVRDAIGPDVELMADAYMGWDERYAIDMIRRLQDLDLAWVEEPLLPDDLAGYARIRGAVPTPISGGEHEFTRWGYLQMLTSGAVDIVQPDVNRMGGITEARKVFALASCFNTPVIPHSNQAHNAHLILAHMNAPLIEVFPKGTIRSAYTFYSELFSGEPEAVDGWVTVSERPGLGIEVNEDVLAEYRVAAADPA